MNWKWPDSLSAHPQFAAIQNLQFIPLISGLQEILDSIPEALYIDITFSNPVQCMDSTQETIDFLKAIGPFLAVLAPVIVIWIQKKDKLHKTKYFIELVKSWEELKQIKHQLESENSSPIVLEKVNSLLEEIDGEINNTSDRSNITVFMTIVFVESVMIGILFTSWSDYFNKVFVGSSQDSGLLFLEGIFRSTSARFALLMVFVSISIFLTIMSTKKLANKIQKTHIRNLTLLAAFNVILIAVIVLMSLLLALLDPIVPYW